MDEDSGNCKMAGHVAEEGAGAPRSSMLYMVAAKARHLLASPGAAGTLIFASVFLVLAYRRKKRSSTAGPVDSKKTPTASQEVVRQQSRANPALYRSVSLAMLHGGEKAMQRLMDAHEACRDESKLSSALDDMRNELDKDRMDFNKLHVRLLFTLVLAFSLSLSHCLSPPACFTVSFYSSSGSSATNRDSNKHARNEAFECPMVLRHPFVLLSLNCFR